MKIYVATFHGDLDFPPIAAYSLDEVLRLMQANYKYGLKSLNIEYGPLYDEYITPDPEDDKIEVWEYDTDTNEGKIVWGFWGWHWRIYEFKDDDFVMTRDGNGHGIMPGNDKSLYDLAMEDY